MGDGLLLSGLPIVGLVRQTLLNGLVAAFSPHPSFDG